MIGVHGCGAVMGYLSGAAWRYVNDPVRHRVDFKTYEFIAHQSGTSVDYMRTDVPPSIKVPSDIVKARGTIAGGPGLQNANHFDRRVTGQRGDADRGASKNANK